MSQPLDPIFVVDFSGFSFLSQNRHARSRDLIDFDGWKWHPGATRISEWYSRLTQGVRSRLEGKQRTLLSSRVGTGISWNPLSVLKGVKHPVEFGERTRDCSPGHAGKESPQIAMTGASRGFSQAAAPGWDFS